MVLVPTTHIGAKEGQIAQTVVLTGDPMRIRLMAKKFLKKNVIFAIILDETG